jgi:hypothetical protein
MLLGVITALIGVIGIAVSYWFTKKQERETALRKEKLEHYKVLIESMNGVLAGHISDEGRKTFADACNRVNLIAPQSALKALDALLWEIDPANPALGNGDHDALYSALMRELRKDLHIKPKDKDLEFRFHLRSAPASDSPP